MSASARVGWIARIGLAIAQPRWAIAIASDRRNAGRSGTDLLALIAIVVVATQLRGLFAAAWLGSAVDITLGLRATVTLLTRVLTLNLGFLVVGALLLWAASGSKRNLGRAFDLACVAAVPLFALDLVATTVVHALELPVSPLVGWILRGAAWSWAGALLALAWRPARVASSASIVVQHDVARNGKRAGVAVVVAVLAGLGVQVAWIARNLETMRPVLVGDVAPSIALPAIEANGGLGRTVVPERGKVTIVEFWATWCTPCKQALPKLDALLRKYPNTAGIAINLDDAAAARALFDERRYQLVLVADDGHVSQRYGISSIPHIVVIDGEGRVRLVSRGSTESVEAAVVAALEGHAIGAGAH